MKIFKRINENQIPDTIIPIVIQKIKPYYTRSTNAMENAREEDKFLNLARDSLENNDYKSFFDLLVSPLEYLSDDESYLTILREHDIFVYIINR